MGSIEAVSVVTERTIEAITEEILSRKANAGGEILRIGQCLLEAKAKLSHGEWLPWLEERVEFSARTANRFMKLAQEWSDPTSLSDLGYAKALQLLALPEPERETFMSEHDVSSMTSRELEKAIRERDEARKATEEAQADLKAVRTSHDSMAENLKVANVLLKQAQEEKSAASDHMAELEKELAGLKAAPVEVAVMAVDQAKLDAARAEGEAVQAEEVARLQAELDRAQVSAAGPDVARFEVYFNQAQEAAKQLRELLIKARSRADQDLAGRLSQALAALADQIRRCGE